MARIAGVNIPTNKRVVIALQYIHGIGPAKAREIVNLYKGMSRAKSRAFWQKQRSFARERGRKGAPKVNPNYVALLGQDGVNDVE